MKIQPAHAWIAILGLTMALYWYVDQPVTTETYDCFAKAYGDNRTEKEQRFGFDDSIDGVYDTCDKSKPESDNLPGMDLQEDTAVEDTP